MHEVISLHDFYAFPLSLRRLNHKQYFMHRQTKLLWLLVMPKNATKNYVHKEEYWICNINHREEGNLKYICGDKIEVNIVLF
jgi:hypothetical protein